MPADTLCSGEATCNPDRCNAASVCVDAAPLADNMVCSDNGGSLCCNAVCSVVGATCNACGAPETGPLNITIIESQSLSVGAGHGRKVALGANFAWDPQLTGAVTVAAVGCLANTPNIVPTGSINYAATGTSGSSGFGAIVNGTGGVGTAAPVGFRFCRNGGAS